MALAARKTTTPLSLSRRGNASWAIWFLSLILCATVTWQMHHLQIESVKFRFPDIYYLIEACLYTGAFFSYGLFTGMTFWLDAKFRPYPVYSILIWMIVMLAFNAIGLRFGSPDLLDESAMYIRAITDPYDLRASQLRISGNTVELEGVMNYGITGALKYVLDAHPEIRSVTLKSPGGVAAEGIWMGRLIRARGLDTKTNSYCISSCTFAFLGGVHRQASDSAKFGFHRPSIISSPKEYNKIVVFMHDYLIASGATPAFADEALSHRYRSPWFPDPESLKAGHVTD